MAEKKVGLTMSGYSTEDDDHDRWYWSQVSHGGAGHEDEDRVPPTVAAWDPDEASTSEE